MARAGRTLIVGVGLMTLLPTCLKAQPAAAGTPGTVERLRPNGALAASLLAEARRRSATVRALADEIETTDLLVFLTLSNEPGKWRGGTHFASAGGSFRRLAIKINITLDRNEQIAVLGHELQHALEVARAPDVTDAATLRRLYERIGNPGNRLGDAYETAAAQGVEHRVREEIWRVR